MSYYAWCWATVFFCHIFVHKGKSRNPKTKKAFKKVWFSVQTMNSVAKLPPVVELMRRFSWFQNEIFFQGREFSGVSLSAARSCFPSVGMPRNADAPSDFHSPDADSCCAGGSPLQHWHLLIIKGMKKTSAHHAFLGLYVVLHTPHVAPSRSCGCEVRAMIFL